MKPPVHPMRPGLYHPRMDAPRHTDLNALPLPDLYLALAATGLVRRLLELARDEDLGSAESPWHGRARPDALRAWGGDITSDACIDPSRTGRAEMSARTPGVIAGLACIPELIEVFAPGCRFTPLVQDGASVGANSALGVLEGPLDEVLGLERTLLNLVSRLSGVATRTSEFRRAMGEGRANLYDTRKTTPGLRVLEKYAVRCGGGLCHRIGLFDAVLIKDNHLAGVATGELASYVKAAAERARSLPGHMPPSFIEVEVDTLEQLAAILTLPPGTVDIVLLDNMGPAQLRDAAGMRDRGNPRLQLEASGGVNLATIGDIARTGVDRISVGGLTHAAVSLDIGLDIGDQ
jgi:nicotinate-nucleotide pyrophosphorylase (carboxylating)